MLALIREKQLLIRNNSQPVQGSVGETLRMRFSEDWEGLSITAVFSAGDIRRDVAVEGETLTIPWELYVAEGRALLLNFHGAKGDGSIVRRTPRVSLGYIRRSDAPSGSAPEAPTPSRADQIQALAEQALAAVQALRSDAAGGAFDGEDGVSLTVSVTVIAGGHRVAITDTNGTQSFDVMDGSDGLFIAKYGVTGAYQIEEAYQAGKTAVCVKGLRMYPLTGRIEDPLGWDEPSFVFGDAEENGYRTLCFNSAIDVPAWTEEFTDYRSSAAPLADGTASTGSSDAYARADHVHPTDTSRLAANQGAANAGKFLVVGNDGVVVPVSVPTATGVNF